MRLSKQIKIAKKRLKDIKDMYYNNDKSKEPLMADFFLTTFDCLEDMKRGLHDYGIVSKKSDGWYLIFEKYYKNYTKQYEIKID